MRTGILTDFNRTLFIVTKRQPLRLPVSSSRGIVRVVADEKGSSKGSFVDFSSRSVQNRAECTRLWPFRREMNRYTLGYGYAK